MLIISIVTAVLFVLKAAGLATCSWWLVYAPLLCTHVIQVSQFVWALAIHGERVKSFEFTVFYGAGFTITFKD